MLDNWVFILAIVLMTAAEVLFIMTLRQQAKAFKNRTSLQPLKWLLFGAVTLLISGAAPLIFVYANIVWFHFHQIWIVYVAVLANAFAKLITGILLYFIYKFRTPDDDFFDR